MLKIILVKVYSFIYLCLSCMKARSAPSAAHCLRLKAPFAQFVQPLRPVATAAASVRACNPSRFWSPVSICCSVQEWIPAAGGKKKKKIENGTESRTLARAETKDDKLRVCIALGFFFLSLLIYIKVFFLRVGIKQLLSLAN